jgi:D-3-phosphoglycerate dehydrogenase / 2-oxoglutarate reductase
MAEKTSKFKVLIGEAMAEDGINLLKYNPSFNVVVLDKKDKDKLLSEIKDADALIVRGAVKVTAEILSHANKLKMVGRAGAGYDNIDVVACSSKGIVVMVAPGGNSNGVAELTITLMLSLIRNIPQAKNTMNDGVWAKSKLKGTELRGKIVGLVGLGKIGGLVANICEAMGMKVLALVHNKNKKRTPPFKGQYVDSLDELLPHVDFLSFHVPLNDHTRGMMGEAEIKKMKPGSYIINTSRGAIIDEKALYSALQENVIAGAGIDVYSTEPAKKNDFPFISLDNVIATPHLGATTKESQGNVSRIICENVITALSTNIFLDAVNLPFSITADESAKYQPFIALARNIGQFVAQWSDKKIKSLQITYRFTNRINIKPLMVTTCAEILKTSNENISLINTEDTLKSNNIEVEVKESTQLSFDDSFKVAVEYSEGEQLNIRGVIMGQSVPKIVEIQDLFIEFIPAGYVLMVENKNVPGVVGSLGTLLGNENINISDFHLAQNEPGKNVIGAIVIDQKVSSDILEKIQNLNNIVGVHSMEFN